MKERLDELEAMLRDGMKLSGQSSLGRRLPARASLIVLAGARKGLREHVAANPADERSWRLLSLAEETLLAYPRALEAFKRALELAGKRDKRDLKRLGALRTAAKEWDALQLTAVQLAELGAFLDAQPELPRDFTFTRAWLERAGIPAAGVIAALQARGACCDECVAEIARGTLI